MPFTYDASGMPLTITTATGTYAYRYDAGGSVIALTKADASHSISARYVYDAWGNTVSTSGDVALIAANPYRYRGALGVRWESAVGLYLMGARWYDAAVGRFISRDPIEADRKTSSHAYAKSNPVSQVDPSGLEGYTLTQAERDYCDASWANRARCASAGAAARDAGQRMRAEFGNDGPNGQGEGNAFRHCYAIGRIANHFGPSTARAFGVRHEQQSGSREDPPRNKNAWMDLNNNYFGSERGSAARDYYTNKKQGNEFVADFCIAQARSTQTHFLLIVNSCSQPRPMCNPPRWRYKQWTCYAYTRNRV